MLLGRATLATTALQVGLVLGFTTILAVSEPMLLVHPFGILSKNVPLLALVVAASVPPMARPESSSAAAAAPLRALDIGVPIALLLLRGAPGRSGCQNRRPRRAVRPP